MKLCFISQSGCKRIDAHILVCTHTQIQKSSAPLQTTDSKYCSSYALVFQLKKKQRLDKRMFLTCFTDPKLLLSPSLRYVPASEEIWRQRMRADEQHYDQHGEGRLQQLTCSCAHFLKSNGTNNSHPQQSSLSCALLTKFYLSCKVDGWGVNPDDTGTGVPFSWVLRLLFWFLPSRQELDSTVVIACYGILCPL